jgi:hypothetical protein
MDPSKIKGVADWPTPRTPTEIHQFLGFTEYYRYFIPKYSEIAQPLLHLTKKTTEWDWGTAQTKAFKELKTRMCQKPILIQPNFNKPFYLQSNTSAYGVGIILLQEGERNTTSLAKCSKPI